MSAPHILVVDDEPDIRALIQEILEDEGYEVTTAEDAASARAARRARRPDLVLLDIWMPDTDGISLLKEWSTEGGLEMPVIMMSGHGTIETAVEATRLGAWDFLEKPLSLAKLQLTVQRALEADRLARENLGLREHTQAAVEPIGPSAAMDALRARVRRVAGHDTPVLIVGEAGTGKETLARYLHQLSPRREGPFIRVSGASLASEGAAAELFGAEEAEAVHYGALERANSGTLFIEDVADLAPGIQARLLGALQHRSFVRTGGVEAVAINSRVVAATCHDLARLVEEGRFREDLYYLLNVVPVAVPPLREHPEDIPALVEHFVDQLVRGENLPYRRFSVASQNRLRQYSWPGNVRELRNLVQRLLILGDEPEVAPEEIDLALGSAPRPSAASDMPSFDLPLKEAREQFERAYLEHQLRQGDVSMSEVANRIGIERTHLYRKLKTLGIEPRRSARGSR